MEGRLTVGRRRVLAAASLVCFGLAATTAVAYVTRDGFRLLAAVAFGLVTAAALWYALTRRRFRRGVGLVVAAVALLVLVVLLLGAPRTLLSFLLIWGLSSLGGFTGRLALAPDEATLGAVLAPRGPVPRPRSPVLLMNPKSGGGKAGRYGLAEQAAARGIRTIVLQPGDDLKALATAAVVGGADVIGMAGGDGSQALVATVAIAHGVPFVCVPAGTRNHFAMDLGLNREDVVGALDAFTDGVEHRIDVGRVGDLVFVNNVSLGVYAKIVRSDAYRDAKLQTASDMLPDLLGPDAAPFDLRFDGPDGVAVRSTHMILVSNNPYELTRLASFGRRQALTSGRLGIAAVRVAGAMDAAELVALESVGRLDSFHGWLQWSAPVFEVNSDGMVEVGIDGETLLLDPPLRFEVLPGALRVRLPARLLDAPRSAGTHLTLSSLFDLFRRGGGRPAAGRAAGPPPAAGAPAGRDADAS
jgi:diacylglycerol kinase family enzyme